MLRINHDLLGASQRLAKIADNFDSDVADLGELWRDDIGRGFIQQHLLPVRPQVVQAVSELAMLIEQFESIAKQLQDPDSP